ALRAQAAAQIEPVQLGQLQVEHDRIGAAVARRAQAVLTVERRGNLESVGLERLGHDADEGLIVLNNEYTHGATLGRCAPRPVEQVHARPTAATPATNRSSAPPPPSPAVSIALQTMITPSAPAANASRAVPADAIPNPTSSGRSVCGRTRS